MLREIDTRCLTQSVEKAKYNFGRRGIYNPHRSSCDYRGILQGEFPRESTEETPEQAVYNYYHGRGGS